MRIMVAEWLLLVVMMVIIVLGFKAFDLSHQISVEKIAKIDAINDLAKVRENVYCAEKGIVMSTESALDRGGAFIQIRKTEGRISGTYLIKCDQFGQYNEIAAAGIGGAITYIKGQNEDRKTICVDIDNSIQDINGITYRRVIIDTL